MALTNRQRLFVEAYLTHWNADKAARLAGYSETTARHGSSNILATPEITEEIAHRIAEKVMVADEVLLRLAEQARGEHSDYITPTGVDLGRLVADNKAHLIKSIKRGQFGLNIEFYDAQAALALLGKHLKLFVDRTEVTGKDGKELNTQVHMYMPENGRDTDPGTD
jgi:phage terminase small subunit